VFGENRRAIHYVPGDADIIDEEARQTYLERYGKGFEGRRLDSYDDHGIHFIGLVNVVDLKGGGFKAISGASNSHGSRPT